PQLIPCNRGFEAVQCSAINQPTIGTSPPVRAPAHPARYTTRALSERCRFMANFQTEERSKLRKHWVDQAIGLAMQNKWDDAVRVNQSILELFPNDVDSYNRLGRAQTELGRYREAREAYQRALHLDSTNSIA